VCRVEGGRFQEFGSWNAASGLRPLRAVGSFYEPEAIGAYAYAPVGKSEKEKGVRLKAQGTRHGA